MKEQMNLPNRLTIARVILIPFFMIFLIFPILPEVWTRIVSAAIFILASLTDMLDGMIARKFHLVTDFGKFLDPLADKLLVISAMAVFTERGYMPGWALALVVARELAVTGLRLIAVQNGRVIAAGWSGKVKTTVTMVGIVLMLAFGIPQGLAWLNNTVWILVVITTVWSGTEYFIRNRDVLKESESGSVLS